MLIILSGFSQAICALSTVCIVHTVYGVKWSSIPFTVTLLTRYVIHSV